MHIRKCEWDPQIPRDCSSQTAERRKEEKARSSVGIAKKRAAQTTEKKQEDKARLCAGIARLRAAQTETERKQARNKRR